VNAVKSFGDSVTVDYIEPRILHLGLALAYVHDEWPFAWFVNGQIDHQWEAWITEIPASRFNERDHILLESVGSFFSRAVACSCLNNHLLDSDGACFSSILNHIDCSSATFVIEDGFHRGQDDADGIP
jgi:hypothetical protein